MTITFSEAEALMRRSRSGRRRLGNNTYLYPRGSDSFAVRYHYTDIITIHADGTFTLNTGGWYTTTTKQRINDYGPARVYSEHGVWAVWHKEDPVTPPKMRPCRICRGVGRVVQPRHARYYESSWDREHGSTFRYIFPPVITPARWAECYRCSGTGQQDYGSKPMPVVFENGITVDGDGRVINPAGRDRLNDPVLVARQRAAAKAARLAAAAAEAAAAAAEAAARRGQPAVRYAWVKAHGLAAAHGEVIMFKAVRDDLQSHHRMLYEIGTTVTAPDYDPTPMCGAGLHFSPTVDGARSYDGSATRFLACAVDRRSMIVIDDKVKARSCRVLYEVDAHGVPLDNRE